MIAGGAILLRLGNFCWWLASVLMLGERDSYIPRRGDFEIPLIQWVTQGEFICSYDFDLEGEGRCG
jgi:hypothetical protein